jgi:signal peptidase I
VLRRVGDVALTVGAVIGVLCVIAAVAAAAFGVTPLIVRSGSMEPALPVGSLALAETVLAHEVGTGDIVSIVDDRDQRITHRVVAIRSSADGSTTIRTKGDANRVDDPAPTVVTSVDRVFWTLPFAGYVAAWMSTPAAWALCLLVAAGLAFVAFRPQTRQPDGSEQPEHEGVTRTINAVVVLVSAGAVAVAGAQISDTRAAFVDRASITTGTSTAASSFKVASSEFSCNDNGGAVTNLLDTVSLSWTSAGPGYGTAWS